MPQRLADEEDDIDHRLHALRGVVGRRVADPDGLAGDGVAIAVDHGAGDARVVRDEGRAEALRRAEIEQHHAPARRLVQVVREVGIRLHDAELEQLAKQQPLEQGADGIAPGLRRAASASSGSPSMKSMAMTRGVVRSQCTRGTSSAGSSATSRA